MQFILTPSSADETLPYRLAYLETLSAPMDGMWESGLIPLAKHYLIQSDDRSVGFCCINGQKGLLQIYLVRTHWKWTGEVIQMLIAEGMITHAMAGTNEPFYLALCLDLKKHVETHTILYTDDTIVLPHMERHPDVYLRLSGFNDINRLIQFIGRNTEQGGEWLRGYLDRLITRGESYLLEQHDQWIGLGECRVSDKQLPHADLGMVIDKDWRCQGWGSRIMVLMKQICYSRKMRPICSTTVENSAAQKAIERAGFLAANRLLKIEF